ncbi:metallophosphoesterase [Skermania sp. ID1734]|nr:metallophosphoesterase [Skermania sp. ID1734]
MRIAAIGDIHLGADSSGELRPALLDIGEHADVLLVAGDLTRHGTLAEARVVAGELADLDVPVIGVLGNHDYHSDQQNRILQLLNDAGLIMLEGNSTTVNIDGTTLGVAGVKGFGGGFAGACASMFGERQMKDFVGHTVEIADQLRKALATLTTDVTVVLTHYAPTSDTLAGEPPEIFAFLGSYLLGEPIDEIGADLALHGHAHAGTEHGETAGGIPVRNVAAPVVKSAYAVYELNN